MTRSQHVNDLIVISSNVLPHSSVSRYSNAAKHYCIGVNISERKSGTERKKKREKREVVCFPTARGRNGVHRLYGYCPSYDNPGYLYPGPYAVRTKSQHIRPNKQAKHTTFYTFEEGISFSEHWKLVAESSEFHLTLKRAHIVHFFQLEIRQKKRDILSENRESGIALKSVSLRPKAVLLTPMLLSNNTDNYVFL